MNGLRRIAVGCMLAALAVFGAQIDIARAGPIPLGVFMQFSFTDPGVTATGCFPDDPAGAICIPSSGTPTQFLDATEWTVTAPAGGLLLTVIDAFASGDAFEVLDIGVPIGFTSNPGDSDCGDDPIPCLADAAMSRGFFNLAEGDHSLRIVPISSDGLGSAYLRVAEITEPSASLLLLIAGAFAFGLGSRGRSHDDAARGIDASTRDLAPFDGPFVGPCYLRGFARVAALWCAAVASLAMLHVGQQANGATAAVTRFVGSTASQPLALSADDAFLVVANADNNSVSFFDLRADRNRKVAEVPVQFEPSGVAFMPNGSKAYVANTLSGTVSVIRTNIRNGVISRPSKHIVVGVEPYGLCLTPNGRFLYVSNARSNTVSVIDTATDTVVKTVTNVGPEPRGIAITNDGDGDDTDETAYVTQFLSLPIVGKIDGADDAKRGFVTVITTSTHSVVGQIGVEPIPDTGFKALGDALARIPPGDPTNPANFAFITGAYPNMLNNIAVHGGFAYVPNTGASPNGPVRFNVNTQSLLSVINRTLAQDAGSINMHTAVRDQTGPGRLFITLPWAIGFERASNDGYVVSAASDILIKVIADPATGTPSVQFDPTALPGATRVLQIKVGKNPRGIAINSKDTRAYVANHVSRDISVLDLTSTPERLMATVKSTALPPAGSLLEKIHIGRELYNTSVGVFDPAPGTTTPIVGRMSAAGWGACSTCHTPFGLSDNVVWIFPPGPRRTIPQHTDFDQTDPTRSIMRLLNWSAERDEEEDFELNIRNVSGGQGLIVLDDGVTPDLDVNNFRPRANGGRNQLKVKGVGAWDALKAFMQFGIRAPLSPLPSTDPDVVAGRALFTAANCQSCHGGPQWTSSRLRFTPPPDAALITGGQIIGELRNVGTFDPTAFNEVRQNPAQGAPLGADGFSPASLLSLFAFPQTFLHNGVATSLDTVMNNVTHRSAGTGGVDTLSAPTDRQKVIQFLLSIDGRTTPINP